MVIIQGTPIFLNCMTYTMISTKKKDLFAEGPAVAALLKEELLGTLSTANKPFANRENAN
jgi:hypothetical protein